MKNRKAHITKILSVFMLLVFGIVVIPSGLLHDHEESRSSAVPVEKHCMHKQHIKSAQETCLICAIHFEKHFQIETASFHLYLNDLPVVNGVFKAGSAYTALISASLRGPPSIA